MKKTSNISKAIVGALMTSIFIGMAICPLTIKAVGSYETHTTSEFVEIDDLSLSLRHCADWFRSGYDLRENEKYIEVDFDFSDFGKGATKLINPERFVIISAKDEEGNELLGEDKILTPYTDMPDDEFGDDDETYYKEDLDYESGSYLMTMLLFKVPLNTANITVALYEGNALEGEPLCAFETEVEESAESYEYLDDSDVEDLNNSDTEIDMESDTAE